MGRLHGSHAREALAEAMTRSLMVHPRGRGPKRSREVVHSMPRSRLFVSILAPVGTAIIGYAEGETMDWPTPSGARRFTKEEVLLQPEAANEWEL